MFSSREKKISGFDFFTHVKAPTDSSAEKPANKSSSDMRTPEIAPDSSHVSSMGLFSTVVHYAKEYWDSRKELINSSFINAVPTQHFNDIREEQMSGIELNKIDEAKRYKIGFARKYCALTITHSSIPFLDDEGNFLIIGRQNDIFLNDANVGFLGAVENFNKTEMDNEKKFGKFFPNSHFQAEMSDVLLTGAEIKKITKETDEIICRQQSYDVGHSNCYSSSLFMLAKAIEVVCARNEEKEIMDENICGIYTLLHSALQDNHHLGLGVLNNHVVSEAINKAHAMVRERGLLTLETSEKITDDKDVVEECSRHGKLALR